MGRIPRESKRLAPAFSYRVLEPAVVTCCWRGVGPLGRAALRRDAPKGSAPGVSVNVARTSDWSANSLEPDAPISFPLGAIRKRNQLLDGSRGQDLPQSIPGVPLTLLFHD
ncbi:MAG: hypothetical protein VXX04_04795, partial [Actinomycetota bacterium]|nr:hypothetical protein [Actinomycetota bacterium]